MTCKSDILKTLDDDFFHKGSVNTRLCTVSKCWESKENASVSIIFLLFISALVLTLVEMVTLFSCMCMMASDTFTEMESAASSMLNGPSNFSETWYRASDEGQRERQRERQKLRRKGDEVCYNHIHPNSSYQVIQARKSSVVSLL